MLQNHRLGLVFAVMCLAIVDRAALGDEPILAKGERKLENFDYRGVTLDGGRMRMQLDEVCDYYLRIPNDDLLKGFRRRAGLLAPGQDLGGWYSSGYANFGQIVSGLSRLYIATGNPACRAKVDSLLAEWAKCIAPDGDFLYLPSTLPLYEYDKMVGGLVDAYLYCGNREAVGHLSRITDWAIQNLDRSRQARSGSEWYTLSENLYRSYLATGDAKYRDFAAVWEYPEYWNLFAKKGDLFAAPPIGPREGFYHAYSHVNTFSGAGAAYLVSGEPRYLEILKNAYDYLQANQIFATGGYGPDEEIGPRERMLTKLAVTWKTFETQCGTWAAFKMVKYLLCFTADARYGDWAERLAINGIGATIPMSGDGRVLYYSNYNPHGAEQHNREICWTCCTGTRPQAVADCCDLVYFKDAENLYVNLFTPATVRWSHSGVNIVMRQETRFPEGDTVDFTVRIEPPQKEAAEFGLKIRSPQWLSRPMTARLNGEPVALESDSLHWCALRRQWKDGDRLTVGAPMGLWVSRFDPMHNVPAPSSSPSRSPEGRGDSYPAAIMYGPVVLAVRAPDRSFVTKIDLKRLDQDLTPVAGEALTWRFTRDPAVLLRPFYAYKEGETYYLYLDPAILGRVGHEAVTFSSQWGSAAKCRLTNVAGATAEYTFDGTGIRWLGFGSKDAGQAEVSLDGKVVATVDQYRASMAGNPPFDYPIEWSHKDLQPGKHTIRIKVLEEKAPRSKDRYIHVAGFDVFRDKP